MLQQIQIFKFHNPRRCACAAKVTVVGRVNSCLSVCLSVCYHASEGIVQFYAKMKVHVCTALVYRLFSVFDSWIFEKPSVKSYGVKKPIANEYVLTATSYGADAATFHLNFPRQGLLWFFQSLTVGYMLVRQRATSLSATTAVRVSVFCLQSSVYFPLHFR